LTEVVSVFYSLTLLDNIVHGSLYHYGLQFSYDWANPYWTTFRIAQALLGLTVVSTSVSTIYIFKKYGNAELRMPNIGVDPETPKCAREKTTLQQKNIRMKIEDSTSKKETRKPVIVEQMESSHGESLKSAETEKSKIVPEDRKILWNALYTVYGTSEYNEELDALFRIPQVCSQLPKVPEGVKSNFKVEGSKYRLVECSHFFGYLRSLPRGTVVPDDCYLCLRMVDCYL